MFQLTHAERCSLFLLDHASNELIAKVFDDGANSSSGSSASAVNSSEKVRHGWIHFLASYFLLGSSTYGAAVSKLKIDLAEDEDAEASAAAAEALLLNLGPSRGFRRRLSSLFFPSYAMPWGNVMHTGAMTQQNVQ